MAHPNIGRSNYLKELSDDVISGNKPEILPVALSHTGYNFGDLRDLGWAKYQTEEASTSTQKVWWTYTGPNSIICDGEELKTGDSTDPVEQDDDADEDIHNRD
jgi:hypothetical protein